MYIHTVISNNIFICIYTYDPRRIERESRRYQDKGEFLSERRRHSVTFFAKGGSSGENRNVLTLRYTRFCGMILEKLKFKSSIRYVT